MSAGWPVPGVKAGNHEIAFEEPDTIFLRIVGVLAEEHVERIIAAADPFLAVRPPVFWVLGMAEAGDMPGGSRRRMTEWARQRPSAGSAYVEASVPARMVITMLHHAVRLFTGAQQVMGFFATVEEARAWIATQRRVAPGVGAPG